MVTSVITNSILENCFDLNFCNLPKSINLKEIIPLITEARELTSKYNCEFNLCFYNKSKGLSTDKYFLKCEHKKCLYCEAELKNRSSSRVIYENINNFVGNIHTHPQGDKIYPNGFSPGDWGRFFAGELPMKFGILVSPEKSYLQLKSNESPTYSAQYINGCLFSFKIQEECFNLLEQKVKQKKLKTITSEIIISMNLRIASRYKCGFYEINEITGIAKNLK